MPLEPHIMTEVLIYARTARDMLYKIADMTSSHEISVAVGHVNEGEIENANTKAVLAIAELIKEIRFSTER